MKLKKFRSLDSVILVEEMISSRPSLGNIELNQLIGGNLKNPDHLFGDFDRRDLEMMSFRPSFGNIELIGGLILNADACWEPK